MLHIPEAIEPARVPEKIAKGQTLQGARRLSDEDIVRGCVDRNEKTWQVLAERFKGLAFHICETFQLWGDKEDIWQDSLIILLDKIKDFKEGNLASFISKIVYYKCREKLREIRGHGLIKSLDEMAKIGRVGEPSISIEEVPHRFRYLFYEPIEEKLISDDMLDMANKAINRLPRNFRKVMKARYLEGLSVNEVAYKLKIPLNTVLTRIRRGKIKLVGIVDDIMRKEWKNGKPI